MSNGKLYSYNEFLRYAGYVQQINQSLKQVKDDLELILNGWKLHLCVDFAEIFAMAYPISELIHLDKLPDETKERAYIREKVALAFCFAKARSGLLSNTSHLILLPPYVEEMRTTLSLVRDRLIDLRALSRSYSQMGHRIFDGLHFRDPNMDRIVGEYHEKGKPPSANDRKLIVEYVGDHYQDIVSYMISPRYHGTNWLNDYMRRNIVMSLGKYIMTYFSQEQIRSTELNEALLPARIHEYFKYFLPKISGFAGRTGKIRPNEADAEACAILAALNEKLRNRKEIFILVSHSKATKYAANPIVLTGANGNEIETPGVRDLSYLWVYHIHRKEQMGLTEQTDMKTLRELMLQRIKQTSNILEIFLNSWRKLRTEPYMKDAEYKDIQKALEQVKPVLMQYNNVSLGTETDKDMLAFLNSSVAYADREFIQRVTIVRPIFDIIVDERVMQELIAKREQLHETLNIIEKELESITSIE